MKKFFVLIFLFLIASAGCDDSIKTSLDKQLAGVDKVKIYFNNVIPNPDKAAEQRAIITITNQDTVNMLAQSITDETSEFYKCGYTGTIEFFKSNISISNMQFNLMSECNHIVFRAKNNMYSKKISDKGIEILNGYYRNINTSSSNP